MTARPGSCTIALLKPDAVRRDLIPSMTGRVSSSGLRIIGMRMVTADRMGMHAFYLEHEGRPYFEGLLDHMTSGPLVALHLQARAGYTDAVAVWRVAMGPSDPAKRLPWQIRAVWHTPSMVENLVHGSDSTAAYLRELGVLTAWGYL